MTTRPRTPTKTLPSNAGHRIVKWREAAAKQRQCIVACQVLNSCVSLDEDKHAFLHHQQMDPREVRRSSLA